MFSDSLFSAIKAKTISLICMTDVEITGFCPVNRGATGLPLDSDGRLAKRPDTEETLSSKVRTVLLVQRIVYFGVIAKILSPK